MLTEHNFLNPSLCAHFIDDNNDKIAFRDQFKSLGKSLGKLMPSQFKNNKDIKTESSKKRRERPADDYDPLYN